MKGAVGHFYYHYHKCFEHKSNFVVSGLEGKARVDNKEKDPIHLMGLARKSTTLQPYH